jgi:signal transduction protein with GAF and PtsI domain
MSDEILSAFCKIAEHVWKGDTVDETLASAVEYATAFLNCDECCTYVRQGDELLPWVWKYVNHGSSQLTALSINEGFAALLGQHRAPIAVPTDSVKRTAFKHFEDWSVYPGETFVCAPFLMRSQLVGAITIRHAKPRPYGRHEFKFLSSIGYMIGAELGISRMEQENANLVLELETRKLVERGKGILQRDLGLSNQEAYLALQRQSQQKKQSMKDIAQAIILGAQVRQSAIQPE